ncbi:MAG: tRNA 2-thiouridine(34) synthase MnmA, partial [Candidatus Poribacteria bacterium]
MSGGVDSSVASALLVEKGYDVIGITMRFGFQDSISESGRPQCCSLESVEDARRVCAQLGIPFYAINYETVFKEEIVDYFCKEYSSGRTPNPCIICNQKLKFGKLLELAHQLDADYVATGHYARLHYDQDLKRYILKKGVDSNKDQSYALFSLTQEQLKHILFPIGEYTKYQVRNIARQKSLKVSERPESQELCFISDDNYNRFLKDRMSERLKPGPIVDRSGRVVGQHQGIQFYTIGQRKGLGGNLGKAMYVIKIDPSSNTITIGSKNDLLAKSLTASRANFISIPKLTHPIKALAKIRYKDNGNLGTVYPISDDRFEIIFDKSSMAVTPGQAVVLYDGD